jgi:hypothetical protein
LDFNKSSALVRSAAASSNEYEILTSNAFESSSAWIFTEENLFLDIQVILNRPQT